MSKKNSIGNITSSLELNSSYKIKGSTNKQIVETTKINSIPDHAEQFEVTSNKTNNSTNNNYRNNIMIIFVVGIIFVIIVASVIILAIT